MNGYRQRARSHCAVWVLAGWLIAGAGLFGAAAQSSSPKIEDSILAAARTGEAETIGKLISQSYARRGSFDEGIAKEMLDSLLRGNDLRAFTVLLDELRKTNLGKDWQPDDTALVELVRNGRRDFLESLLARRLELPRLKAAAKTADAPTAEWVSRRAKEVGQERAAIDALVQAAGERDIETMHRLLDSGANVNGVSSDDWTPLTKAARENQVEAVHLLLERGAAVDQPRLPGWDYTALCLTRSVKIAELLKATGANVHAKLFRRDVSILTYICRWGGAEMVEWMLKQGLDPKMIGDHRQNLLFDAGDARTAGVLLTAGVDPNQVDEFGRVPLQYAQQPEIVRELIEAGAKIDSRQIANMPGAFASAESIEAAINALGKLGDGDAQRALLSAAHLNQPGVAKILLAHGAKANEPCHWGMGSSTMLPLVVCAVFGSAETAKVLLDREADPNAGDTPRKPLQIAISNGHIAVAKLLHEAGAKGLPDLAFYIAIKDERRVAEMLQSAPSFAANPGFWSEALATAARVGDLRSVRASLDEGVPMAPDDSGGAFEAAAFEGQHEVLAELLAHRTHSTAEDRPLASALWSAVWNSHPYENQRPAEAFELCVELLLKAAAPLKVDDGRGSLMQAAVFTRNPGGNAKVVEMLAAAGADPNPVVKDQRRLSEAIALSCQKNYCDAPAAKTIAAFEKLAKVSIPR